MPSILSHPAVPLAIGLGLGARKIPPRLLAAGVIASILPDIDVAAFAFGIPYASAFGHRGFTHSLFFAAGVALLCVPALRRAGAGSSRIFLFVFAAAASHGLLDALTTGGSGVALLWPWSDVRIFFPVRFIEVSPIGLGPFLSSRGATVLLSELQWVWAPCALLGVVLARWSRKAQTPDARA